MSRKPAQPHRPARSSQSVRSPKPYSRGPKSAEPSNPPATVSARWLLTAVALTLLLAAFCGYGALCLLFYQGQWQMLFHPSRSITSTPASAGLSYNDVRFDVDEIGVPQLDGWWIPAAPRASWAADTILYLHDGAGSLSDCVSALASLHALGINVFAIDYRGFGLSVGKHPTENLATQDSIAAWTYLTDSRHVPSRDLVVYGDGTGATFAARLAAIFAPAGAIFEDPGKTARQVFTADARARILPLFLLQKERLDPTADLASSHIPRLFLDRRDSTGRAYQLFKVSSYPKQYFDLRSAPASSMVAALRRFLDQVLH